MSVRAFTAVSVSLANARRAAKQYAKELGVEADGLVAELKAIAPASLSAAEIECEWGEEGMNVAFNISWSPKFHGQLVLIIDCDTDEFVVTWEDGGDDYMDLNKVKPEVGMADLQEVLKTPEGMQFEKKVREFNAKVERWVELCVEFANFDWSGQLSK